MKLVMENVHDEPGIFLRQGSKLITARVIVRGPRSQFEEAHIGQTWDNLTSRLETTELKFTKSI